MKKLVSIALVALTVIGASACNTVGGAGKDVERAGEKIQDASKK